MKRLRTIFIVATSVFSLATFLYLINGGEKRSVFDFGGFYKKGNERKLDIKPSNSLSLKALREREFEGSDIVVEKKFEENSFYTSYIASYRSDGLKIYALLTIPKGKDNKYPAIVFNHGYIPPEQYKTTERYEKFIDALSKAVYIVFKIDYRGHGNSEGEPEGGYVSNAYVIDSLNALASLKKFEKVDSERIGFFGHSMGGWITSKALVVRPDDIKAAVIWAGVVGSYEDLFEVWFDKKKGVPYWRISLGDRIKKLFGSRKELLKEASVLEFIDYMETPVQLHHAKTDKHVPIELSERYYRALKKGGKYVEFYRYEHDDHNLTVNFPKAMQRTIEFFDRYLKKTSDG